MKENNWFDPFYIQDHLSNEEKEIQINVREFCNKELRPQVIKNNREAHNEPTIDAFKDLACYGIIAQIVKNGKWGK